MVGAAMSMPRSSANGTDAFELFGARWGRRDKGERERNRESSKHPKKPKKKDAACVLADRSTARLAVVAADGGGRGDVRKREWRMDMGSVFLHIHTHAEVGSFNLRKKEGRVCDRSTKRGALRGLLLLL